MSRVLVTGVLGPAGRALTMQLLALGHAVIGTDMLDGEGEAIQVHRVPPAADPSIVPALRRLAVAQRADLIIPTVSEELPTLAAARAAFDAPLALSGVGPVAIAADKLLTMYALRAAGCAVPRFVVPSDQPLGGEGVFEALGPQVVSKPRVSRGGRGVTVLGHLDEWAHPSDDQILQEFAPGQEYCPAVFLSPDGGTDEVIVLRKTGLKGGRVGNATGVVRDEDAADVAQLALASARALGLVGAVDVDVRRLPDGEPVVLEVNARFGANSTATPELLTRTLAADWATVR